MDKCSSDADFDSYWEYESRNKNRNRIRVGRQYQASVPPLLKPGEKDTRRCEDLETLKWKPDKLSDQCVDQYLSMAKAISRFGRAIDPSLLPEKAIDTPIQTALKGLSEFVTAHHPCHHDDGCQVPNPQLSGESSTKHASSGEWTPNEAQLFAQALEVCGKNFCAIKKDFLPWKPVRSLIEYYYQGKSEKVCSADLTDTPSEDLDNKIEKVEPAEHVETAGVSEDLPKEVLQPKFETNEFSETCSEDCKTEIPEVPCSQSIKVEECERKAEEMKPTDSSTVGSLKFYLGGRLVLKLNAQQYSDSGTKCHWVPSNDTPKRPQLIKRMKHKKKVSQESSAMGYQVHSSNSESQIWDPSEVTECDAVIAKKAKLKSDCESSSEPESSCPFLYSSSWTPPVANGPDVVEMDDGSSKTSEGCISPGQANSLGDMADAKFEGSASAVNSSAASFCDPSDVNEVKTQHECVRVKTEALSSACCASQSETCSSDSNTIQGSHPKSEKPMTNQLIDGSFSQESQNNQTCTKNVSSSDSNTLSFVPRSAVSCSPSKKHRYKWASSPCTDSVDSSKVLSPNSISESSVSRQTAEDSPLDLSSKSENVSQENFVQNVIPSASKVMVSFQNSECSSPSKEEVQQLCNNISDSGLNVSVSSSDSMVTDSTKVLASFVKTEENKISVCECCSGENNEMCTKGENNISSFPEKNLDDRNKASSEFPYPYYNIPCSCNSPKCTNSFALREHLCNKDGIECLEGHSGYLLPVTSRTASGKPPPWYEASVAAYLQYYPQCYPYYVAYGVTPSSCTGSSVAELPLDLSSTCESAKDENVQHNVPEKETSVTPNSAEALEKGMLYHLLKNRNSK